MSVSPAFLSPSPTKSPSASRVGHRESKISEILRRPGEDDDKLAKLVTDTNFFRCILVQDIPDKYDDTMLYKLFVDFGPIERMWIWNKTQRNRHGRATVIFKNAEDAEMAEAMMNETEVEDRTLQVHIGVPPSERMKASEKREKARQQRKAQKAAQNKRNQELRMLQQQREEMFGFPPHYGYGPPPMGPPPMGPQSFNKSYFF